MKIAMIMDPIDSIMPSHDTSFSMLLEAQLRYPHVYYVEPNAIWLRDGIIWARMRHIRVMDNPHSWYEFLSEPFVQPLAECDVVLLRKDPPFDVDYLYLTYLLEKAEEQGCWVLNRSSSVRDANEKLFCMWFPQCCPRTLVTSDMSVIREFVQAEGDAVIKALDSMGGRSVFRIKQGDTNFPAIMEHMTQYGKRRVMVQQYIPAIAEGDKRILMINGEPIPYALARVPAANDFRGNMAAGASVEARELTEHDYWIASEVGPILREKGLLFVGLDVIGKYLTEINVTSPTCARELDALCHLNIAGIFFDAIEAEMSNNALGGNIVKTN